MTAADSESGGVRGEVPLDRSQGRSFARLPAGRDGSEIARCDEGARAATDGFLKLVDVIAGQFGKISPACRETAALVVASTMIGALTMARIATDPELSAEILGVAEKSLALG